MNEPQVLTYVKVVEELLAAAAELQRWPPLAEALRVAPGEHGGPMLPDELLQQPCAAQLGADRANPLQRHPGGPCRFK